MLNLLPFNMRCLLSFAIIIREQSWWAQHGAHLGPVSRRWAPCRPHEPCYQGNSVSNDLVRCTGTPDKALPWYVMRCKALAAFGSAYLSTTFVFVTQGSPSMKSFLLLTLWGLDKVAAIFQTTFPNAFSWMELYAFRLRFHWSLLLRFELTIFRHWFR